MSRIVVPLDHAWKIGDAEHREVELRAPNAQDVIEAGEAAERVVATPTGYALVSSPTRAGIELLKRQVVRIGDTKEPELTVAMLKGLHPDDLEKLQQAADRLDRAAEATAERGRGDPPRS